MQIPSEVKPAYYSKIPFLYTIKYVTCKKQ